MQMKSKMLWVSITAFSLAFSLMGAGSSLAASTDNQAGTVIQETGNRVGTPHEVKPAAVSQKIVLESEKAEPPAALRQEGSMDEKELETLRQSVRKIDKDLAKLFQKRLELSKSIAAYKLKANKPIYDAKREEKNIKDLSELIEDVSQRPDFIKWYQMLMDISKKVQTKLIKGE